MTVTWFSRIFAFLRTPVLPLAIVQLRAHRVEAQSRDAIGLAAMRLDQTAPLELLEQVERAIRQSMAVAVVAIDLGDTIVAPDMLNASALREAVQHALLQFRDIHGRCLS